MKANKLSCKDLMIGDWVLDGNVYAQVTSITCDGIIETTHNEHSNIELVEPIPLTPDIIEKNGFKPYIPENHLETVYACQDVSKAVADELYALWPYQDGSFYLLLRVDGKDMVRMDVHYIHQLQHALRLCGIDKEIEL